MLRKTSKGAKEFINAMDRYIIELTSDKKEMYPDLYKSKQCRILPKKAKQDIMQGALTKETN